jgi:hypothetical protein
MATLFVAAAGFVYGLWLTGVGLANTSSRVVGAVVFGLGAAACTTNQAEMAVVYGAGDRRRPPMAYVVVASLVGFVALVAGIATLVTGNEGTLAVLAATTGALWAMATVRHAGAWAVRGADERIPETFRKAA